MGLGTEARAKGPPLERAWYCCVVSEAMIVDFAVVEAVRKGVLEIDISWDRKKRCLSRTLSNGFLSKDVYAMLLQSTHIKVRDGNIKGLSEIAVIDAGSEFQRRQVRFSLSVSYFTFERERCCQSHRIIALHRAIDDKLCTRNPDLMGRCRQSATAPPQQTKPLSGIRKPKLPTNQNATNAFQMHECTM